MKNPQAFPRPVSVLGDVKQFNYEIYPELDGMTLLDWFAGQALAGNLAAAPHPDFMSDGICAARAYNLAEAMLKERQKRLEPKS